MTRSNLRGIGISGWRALALSESLIGINQTVASGQIGLLARMQVSTDLAYQGAPIRCVLRVPHGIVTPAD